MLKQAIYRERVLLACSAQEPKLLPKQGMSKKQAAAKIESMLGSYFDEVVKADDERRKKTKCQLELSKQAEQ